MRGSPTPPARLQTIASCSFVTSCCGFCGRPSTPLKPNQYRPSGIAKNSATVMQKAIDMIKRNRRITPNFLVPRLSDTLLGDCCWPDTEDRRSVRSSTCNRPDLHPRIADGVPFKNDLARVDDCWQIRLIDFILVFVCLFIVIGGNRKADANVASSGGRKLHRNIRLHTFKFSFAA